MADESQRNRRGAKDTAAEAVKWGKRARWLLGFTGCGGCLPGCGTLFLALVVFVLALALIMYACRDFLWGFVGWLESIAAQIGLTPGICNLLK